jgi:protein involved in polysaccharide export with SLBB domain
VPRKTNLHLTSGRAARTSLAVLAVVLGFAVALGAQAQPREGSGFQPGDRILLRVAGELELTDTFTVSAGPALILPVVGSVSLAGVKRDSVETVLAAAVAKFFRDPLVHARALVRVAVLGEVLRPGFYAVPSDSRVADVVMAAGGPTPFAQVDGLRVTRDGAELLSRDATKKVVAQGLTLSQIDIRSEDQFVVPRAADAARTIQIISILVTIPLAIITVLILRR